MNVIGTFWWAMMRELIHIVWLADILNLLKIQLTRIFLNFVLRMFRLDDLLVMYLASDTLYVICVWLWRNHNKKRSSHYQCIIISSAVAALLFNWSLNGHLKSNEISSQMAHGQHADVVRMTSECEIPWELSVYYVQTTCTHVVCNPGGEQSQMWRLSD